ncbi:F-box/LRR-repeat protein 2-like isoform X4 [Palaemon carinicauda]|uniref:F-box/LRR-repeat protein 2-like isoform X4 n=1 Tax=Palaemon carinicauda TaxID=392227 RepID=UPI0035B5A50B
MSINSLPYEVLSGIFYYLGVSDLLAASSVCKQWREAAASLLSKRVTIMITDDAAPAVETFLASSIVYQNWVFKELDVSFEGRFADLWRKMSHDTKSLMLLNADCNERSFISLLKSCVQLKELRLNGLAHLLMPGNLLNNPEDVEVLASALKHVTRLHLACSRYLTDCLFSRLMSVVGSLTKLSLAGCQISFHSAIFKRFYPADGRVQASDHVLTFDHILNYIEKNASTLREISLGRTSVDSESLHKLSKVPGLKLESVHLMSCDQLSKSGIQLLCKNQQFITDLDLSLCSRITDYAVLSVRDNLHCIKKLNLRRCRGITENGIRELRQLKHLEELNISHLEAVSSESVEEALGKEPRPKLKWLSVASLDLEWKAVASIAAMAPNLLHLDISMCVAGVNDKSVQAICESLTKLQVLYLNGCTAVSDIGLAGHGLGQKDVQSTELSLENFGIKEKGLQELNLCGCKKITDITLVYAVKFRELRYLNLSHCQGIAQDGIESVARECPSLEILMLVECAKITDHSILVITHYLKRLKTLDVQNCYQLTDDALDCLSNSHTLRYLDVSGCIKMSLQEVRHVQNKIPLLRNFHYRGVRERNPNDAEEESWPVADIPPPPPFLSKPKKNVLTFYKKVMGRFRW